MKQPNIAHFKGVYEVVLYINDKKVEGDQFAYDGCHKIYILESALDKNKAKEYEYQIMDISELEQTYNTSCPLRFIDNWALDKTYVAQGEDATFELRKEA